MPFQSKIQPLDSKELAMIKNSDKPAAKSRLKRLFERQFPKFSGAGGETKEMIIGDNEPSSVCLDKMVLSFMEDDKSSSSKCGRSRCNCFNGNCDDSSDDELLFSSDPTTTIFDAPSEILKGLVVCASLTERNLLADSSKIVEANKTLKKKEELRKIVAKTLRSDGYDASVCKSHWEKTPSFPAGEYEYIDVVVEGERFILDVDFRSEFEIARSTKNYRQTLQSLPVIFVGKTERLQQIVAVVCEAARQSLKKNGLHFPPWRKVEYMKAKWLSAYERESETEAETTTEVVSEVSKSGGVGGTPNKISAVNFKGEFEMDGGGESKITVVVVAQWTPPAVKPRSLTNGVKVGSGLASVLNTELPQSPITF